MSETRADYQVVMAGKVELVTCKKCGNIIGRIVKLDGVELLEAGGMVITVSHGVCGKCFGEFHWAVNERRLEKLLKMVGV